MVFLRMLLWSAMLAFGAGWFVRSAADLLRVHRLRRHGAAAQAEVVRLAEDPDDGRSYVADLRWVTGDGRPVERRAALPRRRAAPLVEGSRVGVLYDRRRPERFQHAGAGTGGAWIGCAQGVLFCAVAVMGLAGAFTGSAP